MINHNMEGIRSSTGNHNSTDNNSNMEVIKNRGTDNLSNMEVSNNMVNPNRATSNNLNTAAKVVTCNKEAKDTVAVLKAPSNTWEIR